MKKLFLILSVLMCICFTFTNAKVNYTTAQQDIAIEKTIDNNTSTKIAQEDYTNTIIIIIAILIYHHSCSACVLWIKRQGSHI